MMSRRKSNFLYRSKAMGLGLACLAIKLARFNGGMLRMITSLS